MPTSPDTTTRPTHHTAGRVTPTGLPVGAPTPRARSAPIALVAERRLPHPAAAVWEVLADHGRDTAWRRGVLSMVASPSGPVAVGTTTTERMRFAGRTYANEGLVTDVDPGTSLSWRTTSGANAEGRRSVVADGPTASVVRLELRVRPSGVERLLAPLLARMLRSNLVGDLQRLEQHLAGDDR